MTILEIPVRVEINAGRVESIGVDALPRRPIISAEWDFPGQRAMIREIVASAGQAPAIDSISPATGDAAGGTAVTVRGRGFLGATAASIGGVALTSFVVVDDRTITGTTGAHAAGAVDVAVNHPLRGTGTLVGGFTYA